MQAVDLDDETNPLRDGPGFTRRVGRIEGLSEPVVEVELEHVPAGQQPEAVEDIRDNACRRGADGPNHILARKACAEQLQLPGPSLSS